MAFEGLQTAIGWYVASTAFSSTDQYSLVKFSSSGAIGTDVRVSDTVGEFCNGVLDDLGTGSSGSAVRVVVQGVTKVLCGSTHAAIAVNSVLYSNSSGYVMVTSSSGFYPVGYALEAIAADTTGIISAWIGPSLNQRTT